MKSSKLLTLAAACAALISASSLHAAITVETSFDGSAAAPTGDTGLTGNWTTTAGGTTASSATFTPGDMPNLPDAYGNSGFVNSGNYIQTFNTPAFRALATPLDFTVDATRYFSFLYAVNGSDNGSGGGLSFFSGANEQLQVGLGQNGTIRIFDIGASDTSTTKTFSTSTSQAIWIVGKIVTSAAGSDIVSINFFKGTDAVPVTEDFLISQNIAGTTSVDTIRFNSPGASGRVPQRFDEFRMGDSWADVTAVPEPATFAILLGLLALGWVGYRRRR